MRLSHSVALALCLSLAGPSFADHPVDRHNLTWTTPSRDSQGSMPLGNGDIGINVWVEEDGDLRFLIGKSDAWTEDTRLSKVGKVRVHLDPSPFAKGQPFRQTLKLAEGEIEIVAGNPESRILVWVDANHPVIHVEAKCGQPTRMTAKSEIWRTYARTIQKDDREEFSALGMENGPDSIVVYPDDVVQGEKDCVVWYHRNKTSPWKFNMELQGLGELTKTYKDPLLNLTFGAMLVGDGLVSDSSQALASKRPQTAFHLTVHPLTKQTETVDAWLAALKAQLKATQAVDLEKARAAHRAWWSDYFNRSYIRMSNASLQEKTLAIDLDPMTAPRVPLRIGADPRGNNTFVGNLDDVMICSRALSGAEVASLAAEEPGPTPKDAMAAWKFDSREGAYVSAVPGGPVVTPQGAPARVPGHTGRALKLAGKDWLEVESAPALRLRDAVTLAAWVRPDDAFNGSGRILDKASPGTDDGYLLDIYQGKPRLILKGTTLTGPERLTPERWVHLAATFDRSAGAVLYVDGKPVAEKRAVALPIDPEWYSQAHTLLRFVYACAGRGAYPIKFNGSLFTVAGAGYDDDYRAWGGGYWFQNTRLPYWSMLETGDFDLMQPFFKLYMDVLPISKERCRLYFKHDGALIPEMIWFWGTYPNRVYGWNREGRSVDWVEAGRIIHHYNGMLELLAIMLDYYQFTQDKAFLDEKLIPMARELLLFWDQHYPRDENGKFVIPAGQALESWDDVKNPAQDIAGLHWVLDGLLALPEAAYPAEQRAQWRKLRECLPPLAITTTRDGQKTLAVGDYYPGPRRNVEAPELYSVFPFRIYGVGKPDLEIARTAWNVRDLRYFWGWHQDDIWAAMLGMTEQAKSYLVQRMLPSNNTLRQGRSDSGQRFPIFWGPGHDWTPDGDHQGVAITTLQSMLMQYNGKISLFPAWPRDWDVDFKLHAPDKTVVEGSYKAGKLVRLAVTPKEREKDVVLPDWLK